jgi:hypothetical protein
MAYSRLHGISPTAHFFSPFFAALVVVVRLRVPSVALAGASSGLAFAGLPG